jgi:hypothetical protein
MLTGLFPGRSFFTRFSEIVIFIVHAMSWLVANYMEGPAVDTIQKKIIPDIGRLRYVAMHNWIGICGFGSATPV